MKKIISLFLSVLLLVSSVLFFNNNTTLADSATPLSVHGQLSVNGTNIVDQNGNNFQLRGLSTHGLAWDGNPYSDIGGTYVNEDTFRSLRDDWGANAVRLAMYVAEYDGYCNGGDQNMLKAKIETGVNAARNVGMYAIIDWHILNENPNIYISQASDFWRETSAKYANYNNVLYEICNEPNNCTWDEIKNYANVIIPIIRANDPDAIIIVGTPTWSQLGAQGHTNEVADSPLTGYTNIVYTLHFYCAEWAHTEYLPNKVRYAMERGLPVFVSEFGLSEASGNGSISTSQADNWLNLLDSYNISYFCWALSRKSESCSLFRTNATSNWTDADLTDAGRYIRDAYRSRREDLSNAQPVNPGNPGNPGNPSNPTPNNPAPVAPIVNPTIESEDRTYAEDFIERLYINMLGRHSDQAGRDYWVNRLAADEINGDQLADGFYYSNEFTEISRTLSNQEYARRMYITILGRTPDSNGLNYWTQKLDSGEMSREQVYRGFLGSQEWHDMCATNDIISGYYQIGRFVDRLYSVILNRVPDRVGRAYWIDQIVNHGTSAYDTAYGFVFSNEFMSRGLSNQDYVIILYNTVLDRNPDSNGLNDWVNRLNNGQNRQNVFDGFMRSNEFVVLAQAYGMRPY